MKGLSRIAIVALVCFAAPAEALVASAAGGKLLTVTPDQLKWEPAAGLPGVTTAVAWGDPAEGMHGAFIKFPAGFAAPLHSHTANSRVVVIQGTITLADEAGKETKLPPGSFFTQPNTFKHTVKCLAGSDCLIYSASNGKWDYKPVKK